MNRLGQSCTSVLTTRKTPPDGSCHVSRLAFNTNETVLDTGQLLPDLRGEWLDWLAKPGKQQLNLVVLGA